MAAAFSFGFAGDDIEDNEAPDLDRTPNPEHSPLIHTTSLPTTRHSLENLVSNTAMQILIFS
jgi:hypothetical protein